MRRVLVFTVLLGAAVSLAGCTSVAPAQSDHSVPAPALENDGARSADGSSAGGVTAEGAAPQADREVVSTGYLTVTADDLADAASDAVRIVEAVGGRVDARSETAPADGDRGSATLTLRIPSARLTSTIDDLKALGDHPDVSISSVDVTAQAQDLDARIGALRASVDRLTALLSTATDTEVLITLETAISDRQGTLESMEAQRRSLADQVSMSTLDLSLISPDDAPAQTPDTFWSGLEAGWAAFVGALGFLLVAAGVLLPWLAVGVVVAGFVWLVLRRRSQRSRAQDVPTA
jgi:hypothetical protein